MLDGKNLYETLGVPHDAELDEIKKKYLAKARLLHPDHNQGLSREESEKRKRQMQELNAAWSVISDEAKRKKYDSTISKEARESLLRQTSEKMTEGILRTDEPVKKPMNQVASQDEMELRGFAKVMRPIPLLAITTLVATAILLGLALGGNSDSQNIGEKYIPEGNEVARIACIDIAPVEEVPCDGRHDADVWKIIGANEKCPAGLSYEYRPQLGGGYCVSYVMKTSP